MQTTEQIKERGDIEDGGEREREKKRKGEGEGGREKGRRRSAHHDSDRENLS